MNLDWRRLKAVVLESDDWGLCAWSADDQARRVLADTPAYRSPAGRRYAGSTLESADDVRQLAATLGEFRGGDGQPPVWQANTILAAPDYTRLKAPLFECDGLPLIEYPATPSRWQRPGAWEAVKRARDEGLWWPELHGLHHLPVAAWLRALRRALADARRAHEQQSLICADVEASGEYDPSEPAERRTRDLERAVARFTALFERPPESFCPPDYRWDDATEADALRLGLNVLQGKAEQHGRSFPRLRRLLLRHRWPADPSGGLYMPPRIAFEPRTPDGPVSRVGVEAAHRAVREAWSRGPPAPVGTHRVNYAHLDSGWAAAGRGALRDLLAALVADGAVFLTDREVRHLLLHGWSERAIGTTAVLVRYYGVPRDPIRFPARRGARGIAVREGRGPEDVHVAIEGDQVIARLNVGEYLLEWR